MDFITQRDCIVVSKFGRAIEFKKGEPTHVPPMCWNEVQAVGAVPVDELPQPESNGPPVPEGAERLAAIKAAVEKMVLRAVRDDFTASGAPNVGVLSTEAGFAIDAKERDTVWASMQSSD